MKDRSVKQAARQGARERSGRYEKMNECEMCGKRMGDYDYFSHGYGGSPECPGGIVLCQKCAAKIETLPAAAAWQAIQAARNAKKPAPTRGRFMVDPAADGWNAVDNKYSTCLWFKTKREAEECCTFARAYVKRNGDINFCSFPYDLDTPPEPFCPECGTLDLPCWTHDAAARLKKENLHVGCC